MEEAGRVMRAGRGTNCPGEGDVCTDSSRKRSLQFLTPRRILARPEVKAQRETALERGGGMLGKTQRVEKDGEVSRQAWGKTLKVGE